MKNKRIIIIISAVFIAAVTMSSCTLFGGKGKSADNNNTGTKYTSETKDSVNQSGMNTLANTKDYKYIPEERVPVWTFSKTDYTQWSQPQPYINPMGSEDSYSEINIEDKGEHTYYYIDDERLLKVRDVYGDTWKLNVPFDEKKTEEQNYQFVEDIRDYVSMMEGDVQGFYDYKLVFVLTDEQETRWWGEAAIEYGSIVLNIVKEHELKTGESITINTEDYDENVAHFSSYNPGNEYQSIHLDYDSGGVDLDIITESASGSYKRIYNTRESVYDLLGNSFYFDSVMYDKGWSNWEVIWDDDSTSEITIRLEKTGEITQIKYGEPLGAIKVSSEYVANIEAFPSGSDSLNIIHPEFSFEDYYLDRTPDGDFIMFVPAGQWDLKIYPEGDSLVKEYGTMMIPVHSGEVTVVDVPFGISRALKAGNEDYNERGIRIGNVTGNENENQVTLDFTLLDSKTKQIMPDVNNTKILEGGAQTKLINIARVETAPDVVLLLDSSGSMKGQMEKTFSAAEKFIKGLPENCIIRIVDFDSTTKELPGTTRDEALKNLKKITVGGSTALYDSIGVGISLLSGTDRPTLVVFTDGENDVKEAGKSLEEVLDLITNDEIPLYTIGFGDGHDGTTLQMLAKASDGQYFKASDAKALEGVFAAINERLGSTFEVTYERPLEASLGDIPVVSFVVDTSGSMITEDEINGSRIHNVKNLLRQFVLKLPDEIQMQLTEFNDETSVVQALTTNKMQILRGVGGLVACGGTDIAGSVEASYKTLKEIPSTKKVLIYITDAALGTTNEDNNNFKYLLEQMKKDEINVLWVGLGLENEAEDFILAAELTGGEYIVTEEIDELSQSFERALRKVEEKPDDNIGNITIAIEKTTNMGAREAYSSSKLAELPPLKKSSEVIASDTIKYISGGALKQYDKYTADMISGYGVPAEATTITKKMIVDREGKNQAADLKVKEIIFMKKLAGVEAPDNYRFMAMVMEMENIMKEQEVTVYPDGSAHPSAWISGGSKGETVKMKIPYMIPDYSSHFYISFNNDSSYAASKATWLVNKPLAYPGNSSVTINPEKNINGSLVFLVPDLPMEQCALHFYDLNYGHIDIPLVGEMTRREISLEKLPHKEPQKLSESFSLEMTASLEMKTLVEAAGFNGENTDNKGVTAGIGATFKIAEGNFISKMQALINIDPMERFLLKLNTGSGDFFIPVNAATGLVPSGFISPRLLAPGSYNKARWVFEIPQNLAGNKCELFMDLKGDDKNILLEDGEIFQSAANEKFTSEFADLTVNKIVKITDGINEALGSYIIADITIHDKSDGFSSTGIPELFSVVTEEYFIEKPEAEGLETYDEEEGKGLGNFAGGAGGSTQNMLVPSRINEGLILGYTDASIVYDGTSRRGIIIFDAPTVDDREWFFYSEAFEGLKMKVVTGSFEKGLLAEKIYFQQDTVFEEALNLAIDMAVEDYLLRHSEASEQLSENNMELGEAAVDKQDVPVPMLSLYGAELIEKINSVDELITTIKSLRFIPGSSSYGPFEYDFSKEALMTQGYGTEKDFANMTIDVLARLGYQPKMKVVKLTDKGKEELVKMSGINDITTEDLPAVSYVDENNKYHLMVIPFMEDIDKLGRLVYIEAEEQFIERSSKKIQLTINAKGYSKEEGLNEKLGDVSDALGGGGGEPVLISQNLFDELLDLDTLSLDAIDIGVAKDGNKARVFLITAAGEIFGKEYIELDKFDVKGLELVFFLPLKGYVSHYARLDENMGIENLFFTLGINLPDLNEEGALILSKKAQKVYDQAENPSELSALRWYGRNVISKFIASQTRHDQELIENLSLISGRINKPRVIVVTHKAGNKLQTSISLIEIHDEIHRGDEEDIRIFNILSGLYASNLEEEVLMGQPNGIEGIWAKAPEGTELVLLDSFIDSDVRDALANAGLPEDVISHFENGTNLILMPEKPSIIDGYKRWAWYEIDPESYEMISVIDTLEKGAFVESTIVDTVKGAGQYMLGAFKGIETSLWSVAAFSLEKDDYDDILKSAKALALGLADRFGFNYGPVEGSVGSKLSVSQTVGPVKFSFDGSANASQNVLGFSDGFKAGVEYYFSQAK